ncbi:MAG: polysaccharide deacetylase family protein [Lachnospiraceae bacterium]|nr:polysaccharide deacetylase family protein [Lachnospiraceae bacterium]
MRKHIALTFDDGPDSVVTPAVLDMLSRDGVTGSFFLIGKNITDETEAIAREAFSRGFEIENHSFHHYYMDKLAPEIIREEIERNEEILMRITGRPSSFFRPPYLAVSKYMYDNIDLCFIGGLHCEDWDENVSAEERAKRIIEQAVDGAIILLHDMEDNMATVEALDSIIPTLKEKEFEFVTVEEMFRLKGIDPKEKAARGRVFDIVER